MDANFNRAREGLRVCEEVTRFVACDIVLTRAFKNTRHEIVEALKEWNIKRRLLLDSRDSKKDVGKASILSELKRSDYRDIFCANIQRVKESVRVLEEFAKIDNKKASGHFKAIRYILYDLEKKADVKF